MKSFFLTVLLIFNVSSVVAKEANSIELGRDQTFTCQDDFNHTTLTVIAISSECGWIVTVYEHDPLGNMISEITSLEGFLKTPGHVEIISSNGRFGTMVQVGDGEALLFRGGRSMKCQFQ